MLPAFSDSQLTIFDLPSQEDTDHLSIQSHFQLPQQLIDEALCIGSNREKSRIMICAEFRKDKPLVENVAFLQKHYGTNGAGFYFDGRKVSLWYTPEGMRVAWGSTAIVNELMRELSAVHSFSLIQEYAGMALQVDPRNADAYYWLITALNHLGSPEIAKSELNMARQMLEDADYQDLEKHLAEYIENRNSLIYCNT